MLLKSKQGVGNMVDARTLLAAESAGAVARELAEEVVFDSPVARYRGRDDVAHLMSLIATCVTDVRPAQVFTDGPRSVGEFTAAVDGRPIEGVLVQQVDRVGLVDEITLFIRPLARLQRAVEMMGSGLAESPLPSARASGRRS
jgi:hypothetical protein